MSIDAIFSDRRNRQTAGSFTDPDVLTRPALAAARTESRGAMLVDRDRSMLDRRYRGRRLSDMLA
jgi:hypothetical protein